jgi:Ca2+-binding RTX toxin-like protein
VVGDSQHQNGGLYISGILLDGTVHDVLISHTEMKNSYGNGTASEYWNGDGFTTERGVYNVRFEDTVASGNTDAGYDLKSSNTVLVRAVAEGNNRNYRFWSDSITLEDSVSLSPVHSGGVASTIHVWMADGSDVTIDGFTFSDALLPQTLFDLTQGGATLHLSNTEIPLLYQALVLVRGGSVILTNEAPTGLVMAGGTVEENAAAGTWVASLAATDPDSGDSHSFALVGGATNLFEIVGGDIRVKSGAVLDFESQPSYSLTVQVTDQGGLSCSQGVTINLVDVVETGTAGNDVIAGGAGGDLLSGGAGNDTYIVNATGDTVIEATSQGTDLVQASLSGYTLAANVENLTYVGTGNFVGTGNILNNIIASAGGNDTLRGGSGNDTITAGAGNDLVYGDAGVDLIRGGDGKDTIRGGTQNDKIYGDAGDDWLMGEDGRDYLHGGLGNDLLDGGASNDSMVGCAGDDTYVVNNTTDVVLERTGEGIDTVLSSVTYAIGSYVENLTLTGTGAINGTGNGGHNRIIGNGAANILSGGNGNDILDGGAGNDTLAGGQGADTYLFGLGGGSDLISNADTDLGADRLVFGGGIAEDQLWFERSGDNLVVSVLGGADHATLQGWYSSAGSQLDHFELSDGTTLAAAQVQQLVSAMSTLSAPPASLADLTLAQQQSVESVIAANWRSPS